MDIDHLKEELASQRMQFLDAWTRAQVEVRALAAKVAELEQQLEKRKAKK